MTSKGIDVFAYVSSPRFKVVLESRGSNNEVIQGPGYLQSRHFEMDDSFLEHILFIIPTENTGRFTMHAQMDGQEILQKWAEISPYTGGAYGENSHDNLNNMVCNQISQVKTGSYAVSFGFFDAGGWSGYSDRAYMYLTDDFSDWMGLLGLKVDVPFGWFVLPGAHDAGMFTVPTSDEAVKALVAAVCEYWNNLSNEQKMEIGIEVGLGAMALVLLTALLGALASVTIANTGAALILGMPRRALINLSNTQKDTIAVQLQLGIRFFDFRPGYNLDGKERVLRHQHNFVPGYYFDAFLNDVVIFLAAHPGEIVVVNLSSAGFMNPTVMIPADGEIEAHIAGAVDAVNVRNNNPDKPLQRGDKASLQSTYKTLVKENRRLIILKGGQRDSYSDDAYQTQNSSKVLASLDQVLRQPEQDWTCLQLQGTYNGTGGGGFSGALNFSDASSTLMWTKADFDHATYPWALNNVAARGGTSLCVMQNDFADNALTDICIAATKQRILRFGLIIQSDSFSAAASKNIAVDRAGYIFALDATAPVVVEYEFELWGKGSVYCRLDVLYAADDSCPVELYLNGEFLPQSALATVTGKDPLLETVGSVQLISGLNRLKIISNGPIPQIREFRCTPEIITIPAASFNGDSKNIGVTGQWGDGVICNVGAGDLNLAEYTIQYSGPTAAMHRLEIDFAAADSRPVTVTLNNILMAPAALATVTGGWMPKNEELEVVGFGVLQPGKNLLKIQRNGVIPHIKELRFVPDDPAKPKCYGLVYVQKPEGRPRIDNSIRLYDQIWAGEKDRSRLLEGFAFTLATGVKDLDIEYMGHLQDKGDTVWGSGTCGTYCKGGRLEGFAFRLTGAAAECYDVFYQALLEGCGETAVCANGDFCGTRGESRGCLAIKTWIRQKPV